MKFVGQESGLSWRMILNSLESFRFILTEKGQSNNKMEKREAEEKQS